MPKSWLSESEKRADGKQSAEESTGGGQPQRNQEEAAQGDAQPGLFHVPASFCHSVDSPSLASICASWLRS